MNSLQQTIAKKAAERKLKSATGGSGKSKTKKKKSGKRKSTKSKSKISSSSTETSQSTDKSRVSTRRRSSTPRAPSRPLSERLTVPGCCKQIPAFFVKTIHVIDIFMGIALLAYSIAIFVYKPAPKVIAGIILCSWALILFVPSVVGIVGYNKKFNPWHFGFSAYGSLLIAIANISIVTTVLIKKTQFFMYLDENADELYLNDRKIQDVRDNFALCYGFLIGFSLVEFYRLFSLLKVRRELMRVANTRASALGTPLISGDEEAGRSSIDPAVMGVASSLTLAEPPEAAWSGEESKEPVGSRSFMASLAAPFASKNDKDGNGIVGSSDDEFAPIDEDLHYESLYWSDMMTTPKQAKGDIANLKDDKDDDVV